MKAITTANMTIMILAAGMIILSVVGNVMAAQPVTAGETEGAADDKVAPPEPKSEEEAMKTHQEDEEIAEHEGAKSQDEMDEEALTGVEDIKSLSPEESKLRLKSMTKRMDPNKDGFVDMQELEKWVLTSLKNMNEHRARTDIKHMDSDGDSQLTWEEYLKNHYGYDEAKLKEMEKNVKEARLAKMVRRAQEQFQMADVNKDGKLPEHELRAFLFPQHYKHMSPINVRTLFEYFDKNKDKKITFEEFYESRHEEEFKREKADFEKDFAKLDKDGNKLLENEEIVQWGLPAWEDLAAREAKHLMNETDKDKDRKLSYDEIQQKAKQWSMSRITEYGSALERDEL